MNSIRGIFVTLNFRKLALQASAALATAFALAPNASAHTDSLGFVIGNGSGAGLFNVDIFYGSWHSSTPGPEGSLDLTLTNTSTLIGTNPFQLYPGFNGVSDGTLPPGLVAGVNYFFPDYTGGLTGDANGHSIYAFQFVTFTDLIAGSYLFGYNAGSSFTANWQPSDGMINAGTFTINANGQIVIVGAAANTIDTSQSLFTSDIYSSGQGTFDGGTLQMVGAASVLPTNFTVNALNGTIDTNLINGQIDGNFDGVGIINVVGNGFLTVTGANTHGGFLVNHAAIAAGGDSALGASSAALTLNHGTFTPTQTMTIDRDVLISSNYGGAFDVGDDITLTLNGDVSGDGCLYKRGLGSLFLQADASNSIGACVEAGLMAFNSTFTGNVWVDPGAVMQGSGAIVGDVEVGGTLSPGNSPGQLIVAGAVTQLPGSTLLIDIDGLSVGNGAGNYDTLILTGPSGVYTADGELAPILRGITAPANNTFTPSLGDSFTIVTAAGGVTGAFDTLTQPASGLADGTRFDVFYHLNTIVLVVTAEDYGATIAGLGRLNAQNAAAALQAVRPDANTNTGGLGALVDEGLVGLDANELAIAFQQIAGEIHATSIAAAHRNSRAGRDVILARLAERAPGRKAWGEVLGAVAEVGDDIYASAYDYHNGGLIVGVDAPIGAHWIAGGALSFVEASARGTGRATIQSYQASLYARWTSGEIFAHATASYGVDRYDIDRSVGLAGGAVALNTSPSGETGSVDLELGRKFMALEGVLEVLGGASWENVMRGALAENGDDAVALSFGGESDEALRLRVGGRYSRDFVSSFGTLRPYIQAHIIHYAEGATTTLSPSLHGASFESSSADIGDTGLQGGFGLTTERSSGLELYAHYRGEASDNLTEHSARIGARLSW
jgi:uncharacterized protein with beta-barrel porin domain